MLALTVAFLLLRRLYMKEKLIVRDINLKIRTSLLQCLSVEMFSCLIAQNIQILPPAMIVNPISASKDIPRKGKLVLVLFLIRHSYGLSWNPHKQGHLVTASEDTTIRHWYLSEKIFY